MLPGATDRKVVQWGERGISQSQRWSFRFGGASVSVTVSALPTDTHGHVLYKLVRIFNLESKVSFCSCL